ncbi:MAG: hypothetical protein AB7U82_25055 [Blastocatellales bacterium]
MEPEIGFGFHIAEPEARKPELKDCRTKSNQLYFLSGVEKLYREALRHALQCVSMILVGRIILLVDGKQQTKSGKRYADIVEAGRTRN